MCRGGSRGLSKNKSILRAKMRRGENINTMPVGKSPGALEIISTNNSNVSKALGMLTSGRLVSRE